MSSAAFDDNIIPNWYNNNNNNNNNNNKWKMKQGFSN